MPAVLYYGSYGDPVLEEAAGRLCPRRKRAGVACRPQHVGELHRRKRLSAV